jgi:hypothetical protein
MEHTFPCRPSFPSNGRIKRQDPQMRCKNTCCHIPYRPFPPFIPLPSPLSFHSLLFQFHSTGSGFIKTQHFGLCSIPRPFDDDTGNGTGINARSSFSRLVFILNEEKKKGKYNKRRCSTMKLN